MTSPYYIAYSALLVGAWGVLTYKGFSLVGEKAKLQNNPMK